MPNYLMQAVVTLTADSGESEDDCNNVFHYFGGGSGNTPAIVAAAFHTRPVDYYVDDFGEDFPVGKYLGHSISRATNAHYVKWREVSQVNGTLGAVVRTDFFTIPATDGTYSLPRESCVVASHHGDFLGDPEIISQEPTGPEGDIHPRARKRGRRFIGPLVLGATAMDGTILRPTQDFVDVLVLAEQNSADGGAEVVVSMADTSGPQFYPIVGGWIDNELDTQRRRGQRSTARTAWTV